MRKKNERYIQLFQEFIHSGFVAFALNFILALVVFGYYMLKEKGLFSLSYDFDSQMIPFTKVTLDTLHRDSGLWNWNIDLGSNIVSSMSYYTLGSPFFWLFSWCKGENVLYIVGWEYIAKYAIAGLTSFYYFKRHTKNKILALIGSVLYSFSGFQTTNLLFLIFHDAVAMFPLLLIAFEEMLENDRRGWFVLAVFINATANYYCFIGEVVFLVIYYIFRYLCSDFQHYLKKIGLCIGEGALGILMASVLFIPSMASVLRNSRVSESIPLSFSIGRRDLLQCFMSFMYPNEMMMQRSNIYTEDWTSRSAYLPLIGISLEVAYFFKRKKHDWLKRMLVVMTCLMILPIGNGMFSLFTTNYCRWFYMPIIFMILASIKTMENLKEYKVAFVSAGMVVLMILQYIMFRWWHTNKFELIFIEDRYQFITCLGILGIAILLFISMIRNKFVQQKVLLVTISLYAVITTSYTCNLYQIFDHTDSKLYEDRIEALSQIEAEQGYRYLYEEDNISMLGSFSGINSFISTISGSIPEFWECLGLEKKIFSPIGPAGTNELLSVKYMISSQFIEEYELVETYEKNDITYYLYKMPYYLNIGYTYDTYMDYNDFMLLPEEIRSIVMLRTLVISEQSVGQLQGMRKLDIADVENLSKNDIPFLIEDHKKENAKEFEIGKDKFTCKITAQKGEYAFFSVPFDKGWSATVNGRDVNVLKVNGFMAIPLEAGDNQIEFHYFDELFCIAILLSIASLCVWVYYVHRSKIGE